MSPNVECEQINMFYSKELKNKASAIIQNVNQGWQQCATLCECIQDRIDIELKYAKGLEKLATKLGSINEFFSSSFGINAQLAQQIGEQLKGEIDQIKQTVNQQKLSPYLDYLKLWDNQLSSIKSDLKIAENILKNKKREYEIEGTLDLVFQVCQPEKAEKQRIKAQNSRKEYQQAQSNYKELQQELEFVWNEKEAEITMDQIQQQNLERLNTIKDCMLKIFVYESSVAKNHMYDLEKMSERLHEQDQSIFIEEFIKKNKVQDPPQLEFESFLTKLMETQNQIQNQTTIIYQVGNEKTEEELQAEITNIVASQQKQEEFLNFLADRFNKSQFQLTLQEFIQSTNIALAILDICSEKKNAIFAQQILQYSFGLFTKDQQTRYMQDMLINHTIWQYRDFWEAIIINQISKIKTTSKETINTSILSILTQTSQHMLMFKLSPDLVRDIVQKFCQFFKLNKDIAADLIQAINSQI